MRDPRNIALKNGGGDDETIAHAQWRVVDEIASVDKVEGEKTMILR